MLKPGSPSETWVSTETGRPVTPSRVAEDFGHLLKDHPLRREILATVLAGRVLNDEGITFVTNADVGGSGDSAVDMAQLRADNDAVLLYDAAYEGFITDADVPHRIKYRKFSR